MFLDLDKHNQDKTAIKDDSGYELSYRDVCDTVRAFEELALPRCVVFCMCESCAGSLVGYLAFENNKQVPLLLSAKLDRSRAFWAFMSTRYTRSLRWSSL